MSATETEKKGFIGRLLFFVKLVEIRLRFIAILVVTALVVGYWDTIQNYYDRWQRERMAATGQLHAGHGGEAPTGEFEFFCPMHPFVVRESAGKCPICGMDLVQRRKGAAVQLPEGVLTRVQVSPERIMQAGVQIEPVAYRLLLKTARSYALIAPDETRMARIIARFPGRVDELMVNATGQVVKQGEALARIYSPKFLAAAQEYLQALTAQRNTEKDAQAGADAKRRAREIAEFARARLALAGFPPEQLDAIARNGKADDSVTLVSPLAGTVLEKNVLLGQMVEEGTVLYTIADLSTVWIQIQVIESDIAAVKLGMPVEVTAVSRPGEIFYGTVDFIYPTVDPDTRSVKVRVVVTNRDYQLKPGMYVTGVIRSPLGRYGRLGTPGEPKVEAGEHVIKVEAGGQPESARPKAAVKLPTMTEADAKAFRAALKPGAEYYECPMHPEVVSSKSDKCPKCGMRLEKKTRGAGESGSAAVPTKLPTTTEAEAQAFLAAVKPGSEYYFCPMDAEVVSDKPADCPKCGMHLEKKLKEAAKPGPLRAEAASTERWIEGWTCPMHLDVFQTHGGKCELCGCGMETSLWRVERVLSIPETAVIDTGNRQIVYVEGMPGVYDAHAVTLGPRAGAYYPVLGGLTLGQKIVTRGSFLIDAEARLNPIAAGGSTTTGTAAVSGMPGMPGMSGMGGMKMPGTEPGGAKPKDK